MTLDQGRRKIIGEMEGIYEAEEARNIAAMLIEYVTKLPRLETIVRRDEKLSSSQEGHLGEFISRLQNHEPVQYITHEAWFAGMKFYVDKNVLIPRPETEELVDWIVKDWKAKNSSAKILDVGTGSGCIAIALKKQLAGAEIWACDLSDDAISIARMNADSMQAAIDFVGLDFLDEKQRKQLPHFDIIVSNPPYIPKEERQELKRNVVDYEPWNALFAPGEDPITFYRSIAGFGKDRLNRGGNIYVEIHRDFAVEVKRVFLSMGYRSVEIRKDLQGNDRMLRIA